MRPQPSRTRGDIPERPRPPPSSNAPSARPPVRLTGQSKNLAKAARTHPASSSDNPDVCGSFVDIAGDAYPNVGSGKDMPSVTLRDLYS